MVLLLLFLLVLLGIVIINKCLLFGLQLVAFQRFRFDHRFVVLVLVAWDRYFNDMIRYFDPLIANDLSLSNLFIQQYNNAL